jgi:putative membrane protein
MSKFHSLWQQVSDESGSSEEPRRSKPHEQERSQKSRSHKGHNGEEDAATLKAASAISEGVFDYSLSKDEKKVAGVAAHYAMGATSGAIYGAMAEFTPRVSAGAGIPFGTVVWLVADEMLLPALGLSKPPTEYPISKHAYGLAAHFVYGLTTDVVRRAVRTAL